MRDKSLKRYLPFEDLINGKKKVFEPPEKSAFSDDEGKELFECAERLHYGSRTFNFERHPLDLRESLLVATSLFINEYGVIDKNDTLTLPDEIKNLIEELREEINNEENKGDNPKLLAAIKLIINKITNHDQIPPRFKDDINKAIEIKSNYIEVKLDESIAKEDDRSNILETKNDSNFIPLFEKTSGTAAGFIGTKIQNKYAKKNTNELKKMKSINAKDTNLWLVKIAEEKNATKEIINVFQEKEYGGKLRKVNIKNHENDYVLASKFIKNVKTLNELKKEKQFNVDGAFQRKEFVNSFDIKSFLKIALLNLLTDNSDAHRYNLLIKSTNSKNKIFIIDPIHNNGMYNGKNLLLYDPREKFFQAIQNKDFNEATNILIHASALKPNLVTGKHSTFDVLPFAAETRTIIASKIKAQDLKSVIQEFTSDDKLDKLRAMCKKKPVLLLILQLILNY